MNRQDGVTETRRREVRLELFAVQARLVREFIDAACAARGRTLSSLVRRAVRRQLERLLRPLFTAYADAACPPDEHYELAVRAMLATWVWPAAIAGEGTQTQAEYGDWRQLRTR